MANPHKGEVAIAAGDATYTWCFSANAIASLEDRLDRGVFDISEEIELWMPPRDGAGHLVSEDPGAVRVRMGKVRVGFLREVFLSGFVDAHKDLTLADAGRIMDEIGGMHVALAMVLKGMSIAFPQAEASGTVNPPQAPAPSPDGTGPASSSSGRRAGSTRTRSGPKRHA
jgi:hypothetical protein